MNKFDIKAGEWDKDPMHWKRSIAVAQTILQMVPVSTNMKALEYGAGTGILSFLLSENFSEITLMDNSSEMVKVIGEKVTKNKVTNLKPLLFNLEHSDYHDNKFDCIFLQMVLHHVADTKQLLKKFYQLLNPEGYLAIADLYPEDGSFHNTDTNIHKGFNPEELSETLLSTGFKSTKHQTSFEIKRDSGKSFPVFLLTAKK